MSAGDKHSELNASVMASSAPQAVSGSPEAVATSHHGGHQWPPLATTGHHPATASRGMTSPDNYRPPAERTHSQDILASNLLEILCSRSDRLLWTDNQLKHS